MEVNIFFFDYNIECISVSKKWVCLHSSPTFDDNNNNTIYIHNNVYFRCKFKNMYIVWNIDS